MAQLQLLIQQSEAVTYLVPIALEHLERDPLVECRFFRGDLLVTVLRVEIHWIELSEATPRMRAVVERALATLEDVRPVDWAAGEVPDSDGPGEFDRRNLEPALRAFLERTVSGSSSTSTLS